MPAPDDNLILSPGSSLVNNLNNDGPELLVPDRTVPCSAQFISDESSAAGLDEEAGYSTRSPEVGEGDDFCDPLTAGASLKLRRSIGREKTKYTGFLQIFSILHVP